MSETVSETVSEVGDPRCRAAIVTEVRAPYTQLGEWLQYHRSIGFGHVYLYCADADPVACVMQTATWCEAGFVTLIHAPGQRHPNWFFADYAAHHRDEAAWAIMLRTHEFLCLPQAGTVGAFLDSLPPYWECVQFNLLPFGGNLTGADRGSVLLRCIASASAPTPLLRPLTRSNRITPGAALAMTGDVAWLDWHERVDNELRCFDVLGRIIRFYRIDFPTNALAYLGDARVSARILARGVVCHILPPDPRRDGLETMRLAERSTVLPFPHLSRQVERAIAVHLRRTVTPPRNLALGRPAQQSSVCMFSRGSTEADDAAGAVSGFRTGRFQFHTGLEDEPWWMVDLGDSVELHEVHLYNRLDVGEERAARLSLRISLDGERWQEIYRRDDPSPFGLGGTALVWTADRKLVTRYLRVVLLGYNFLHLDQVEVYGVRRSAEQFYL